MPHRARSLRGCTDAGYCGPLKTHTMPVNLWTVTVAAAITAIATGLGAFPLWFVSRDQAEKMVRIGSGAAALLMTAASGVLLWQGFTLGGASTLAGATVGGLGLLISAARSGRTTISSLVAFEVKTR